MSEVTGAVTLTVDGVEFRFKPTNNTTTSTSSGQISFQREGNVFMVHLDKFTGSMRVESESTMSFDAAGSAELSFGTSTKTPKVKNALYATSINDPEPLLESNSVIVAPPLAKKRKHVTDVKKEILSPKNEAAAYDYEALHSSPSAENQQHEPAATQDTVPTVLGQPDCSQMSQFCSMAQSQDTEMYDSPSLGEYEEQQVENRGQSRPESSRVQEIMDEVANASTQMTADSQDSDADELAMRPAPARVSLGSSPQASPMFRQEPPCRRWGHSMTLIGKDRVLIYGGQTLDSDTKKPKTLNDIHIYNMHSNSWFQPRGVQAMPRQWHTCSYLPDRQLLVAFGGEATKETKSASKLKSSTTSDPSLMVLDCEIMLWYPPVVTGDAPSARSGHTATLLVGHNQLVVFGGVQAGSGNKAVGGSQKWLNRISVLDTTAWKWSSPKVQGSPPKPRSYHSASAVKGKRIVVVGGNDADASFNSVHVLEYHPAEDTHEDDKRPGSYWRWTHPTVKGLFPCARTGHSATVLKDGKTICIYGGWDPNADDDNAIGDDDSFMIFDDCFLLDTETWIWKKCPAKPLYADIPLHVQGIDGGARRVGHTAVLDDDDNVLIFGGRVPRDRFTGDFQSIATSDM